MNETKFEEWAILELMGHRRLAGKVTESAIGGGSFIRIDMPMKDGSSSTQFYSPGSIYCITPTTEAIAREVALASQPEPVSQWEFRQLVESKSTSGINQDDFPNGPEVLNDAEDNDGVPF